MGKNGCFVQLKAHLQHNKVSKKGNGSEKLPKPHNLIYIMHINEKTEHD